MCKEMLVLVLEVRANRASDRTSNAPEVDDCLCNYIRERDSSDESSNNVSKIDSSKELRGG